MAARLPDAQELAVQLVPMRRRHLRSVLHIETHAYPTPWSFSLFMSELALRGSRAYYVARVGGSVVGYGGIMLVAEDAHVTTLAVHPNWQRQQIASRLLLQLTRAAIARGARHLTLEVRINNTGAQELYRKFGFAPVGVRRGYYVETNEDALIMWAEEIDGPAHTARLREIEAGIAGSTVVDDWAS
jgi:ribosomal-protein-alanine N-acetyltransferase